MSEREAYSFPCIELGDGVDRWSVDGWPEDPARDRATVRRAVRYADDGHVDDDDRCRTSASNTSVLR